MDYRSTLVSFALASSGLLFAQPQLDLTSNGPVPQASPYAVTSYTTSAPAEFIGPGTAGADQLYGFWMLPWTGNHDRFFVAPSVTPTSSSFPGATVLSTNGGQDTSFYKVDANGVELLGLRGSLEGVAPYTNGLLELKLPCTFGTTWTDSYAGTYMVSGFTVNRSGTINGIADGYGDIQLPAQVLSNVLRVFVRKVQLDLSQFVNATRTYDSYYYYQEGLPFPVTKTSVDSVVIGTGSPTVTYTAEWLYGPAPEVGLDEVSINDIQFTPYPNPTNGRVDLQLGSTEVRAVEVFTATGQLVRADRLRANANGAGSVDLSGLPAGVYQVRITDMEGRTGDRRVVLN